MKTSAKNFIYALALTTVLAFSASAEDKKTKKVTAFGTGIYATKTGKINVNVNKYNEKLTVIQLQDKRGNILYQEVVNKNETKFRRSLDVNELPTGEYTLQIMSDGEKQIKKVEVNEKHPERVISMN
ncbi:T9SS type A sorting domain-containing protein [Dyadobacter sp. NIV53]|uniref:T9SS type A sorting domain-containing protein n=1 Tax=Dyadobacter sp. NIV53 TaxID=2861765 RepID=UPI001C87D7E4|nr:T9SS type A sorting domain-containing protein [Dyadobacter sp. NIV53]